MSSIAKYILNKDEDKNIHEKKVHLQEDRTNALQRTSDDNWRVLIYRNADDFKVMAVQTSVHVYHILSPWLLDLVQILHDDVV